MRCELADLDPSLRQHNRFSDWVKGLEKTSKEGCGDQDALNKLSELTSSALTGEEEPSSKKLKLKCADAGRVADTAFRLREHCHLLRRLEKELVGRVRCWLLHIAPNQLVGLCDTLKLYEQCSRQAGPELWLPAVMGVGHPWMRPS